MSLEGSRFIPLHKPYWDNKEEKAAIAALRGGTGVGDLSFGEKLSDELARKLGVKYVLPTSSGTAALELACACILKRGDEVIMPSFTFSSCANAALLRGARPVFCDISIDDYNIDPKKIIEKITPKTKAIMVVHYAGFACDMDQILDIAKKNNLYVIEDAAHSLNAKYKNRFLGTIGDIGCLSFHGTKNVASGEGGAFVSNNEAFNLKAEIFREKGTNRSSFIRGERNKYSWVSLGSSLVLSDILSAIALEQVKKLEKITKLREQKAKYYLSKFRKSHSKLILPTIKKEQKSNWHIFAVRVSPDSRDEVISKIRSAGIEASFHYLPLHTSLMGRKLGYKKGDLPVTEEVSDSLIRLPIYPQLKKTEMDYIVKVVSGIV